MFGMQIDWRVGLDFLFSVRLICILNEACRGWAPDALRPWSKSLSTRLADVMTGRGQEPGLSRDPVTSPGGCLNSPPPRFNSSGVTVRFQCHRPSAHAVYHWRWHWNFSSVGFQTELMRSRRLETELLRSVRRIRGIEVVLICGWGSPARKLGSIIFFFFLFFPFSFFLLILYSLKTIRVDRHVVNIPFDCIALDWSSWKWREGAGKCPTRVPQLPEVVAGCRTPRDWRSTALDDGWAPCHLTAINRANWCNK